MPKTITHAFHAHGQMGKLFQLIDDIINERVEQGVYQILLDGPSGTGKTRAALEVVRMLCRANMFYGVRALLARKTLKSMRDTTLVEWESAVLLPSELPRSQLLSQAPHYSFSATGAKIVCGGFDDPAKILSGQYDIVFFNEGKQITKEDYNTTLTRMRNCKLNGWHLVLIDTNPDAPTHWLNQMAKDAEKKGINNGLDGMLRIKNELDDNPRWVDQETGEYTKDGDKYVGILDKLEGVYYKRYRKGIWCMAEDAIWQNYDQDKHLLNIATDPNTGMKLLTQRVSDKRWQLEVHEWGPGAIELTWFFAAVDWGFKAPGSMLIFGVDAKGRMFLVEEHYMTGAGDLHGQGDIDWWAERADLAKKKWDVLRFACDSHRPDCIHMFNKRMNLPGIAIPVEKRKLGFEASASAVRERFTNGTLYFLRDTLVQVDATLKEDHKPLCLVDEIPAYEYKETKDDQRTREEPKDGGDDHGCDALRYACWFMLDNKNWGPGTTESAYPPGSYGRLLGHDDVTGKYIGDQYHPRSY